MIADVSARAAQALVSELHYSHSCVAGALRYGWEIGGELVGASVYNNGSHDMRKSVFGPEQYSSVLHHHRLAIKPEAPKNTASEFLAACLKQIKQDRPQTRAIVTYADMTQGHRGGIYRATNALYTGVVTKGNLMFVTPTGEFRTTDGLKRFGTWPERRKAAAEMGWAETRSLGKLRFVHLLGDKRERRDARRELRLPVLDYSEIPIL